MCVCLFVICSTFNQATYLFSGTTFNQIKSVQSLFCSCHLLELVVITAKVCIPSVHMCLLKVNVWGRTKRKASNGQRWRVMEETV